MGRESAGEPVHIATEDIDLSSEELKRGLSYVRKQSRTPKLTGAGISLDAKWQALRTFSPDEFLIRVRVEARVLQSSPRTARGHTPHSNWSDDNEIVVSSKWLNSHVDYQSSSQ